MYITPEEVDASHMLDKNTKEKFSKLSDSEKEEAIYRACLYLDMAFPSLAGRKCDKMQEFEFPRCGVEGDAYDAGIPSRIKKAAITALALNVNGGDLLGTSEASVVQMSFGPGFGLQMESLKEVKIGDIAVKLKDDIVSDNKVSMLNPPDNIALLMAPFVKCAAGSTRGMSSFNMFGLR